MFLFTSGRCFHIFYAVLNLLLLVLLLLLSSLFGGCFYHDFRWLTISILIPGASCSFFAIIPVTDMTISNFFQHIFASSFILTGPFRIFSFWGFKRLLFFTFSIVSGLKLYTGYSMCTVFPIALNIFKQFCRWPE